MVEAWLGSTDPLNVPSCGTWGYLQEGQGAQDDVLFIAPLETSWAVRGIEGALMSMLENSGISAEHIDTARLSIDRESGFPIIYWKKSADTIGLEKQIIRTLATNEFEDDQVNQYVLCHAVA